MTDSEMRYELQMQFMHEALTEILGRGVKRCAALPLNGYRRRIHFEGLAILGEEITLIAQGAALFVRIAGHDLEGG